ncbi:MAG: DUF2993 domain-containing protein [Cyanobacteriota bacterium]|nr:MAG: DUF2993 domain-containing protein [Phormidium sp. SL48-SHIP]
MTVSAPLSDSATSKGSLSSILSAAVQFWLRSQVERAETLTIEFSGKNRQLLRGEIPQIQVKAQGVVYQGLHLGQVRLEAGAVRLNLRQILQGKPLRLLQPVPVQLAVQLQEDDLTASLASPLLQNAIFEVFAGILPADADLTGAEIQLQGDRLHLLTSPPPGYHLNVGLKAIANDKGTQIDLDSPQLRQNGEANPQTFPRREIPLDATVSIEALTCTQGLLNLSGSLQLTVDG